MFISDNTTIVRTVYYIQNVVINDFDIYRVNTFPVLWFVINNIQ